MEEFLQSLTPALAGVVRDAVGEVGQDRLQQTVSLYTHDIDGSLTWPTERYTAEMVALQFIRDVRPVVSPATASGIDGALGRRASVSAGTGALLTGVGAAAGVYGAQKTMLALTSRVVQRHYEEIDLDFTTYRNLMQSIVAGALRNTTSRANWNLIGSAFAQVGFDPTTWENQVAARYQNELLSNLVGVFARAAWTGQKRTLDQLPAGVVLPDFESSVGQWARNHVERVVYDQNLMTHRVVRGIVNRLQESGAGPQTITSRLRKMWGLTPRDALAVENFRASLAEQGKKAGMINRLADAYVDRLMKQRISLLARTETMNSINMGKQLMWERAMHEGKLPIDIMKIWVTAADEAVCPVCRPMDRVKVPLTSMFTTASGKVVMPPVHPRCRCIAMLVEPEIADVSELGGPQETSTSSADVLVGKHLGGSDGTAPHPSGTGQDIHGGKGRYKTKHKQGKGKVGYHETWTNSPVADIWVRYLDPVALRGGETAAHRAFLDAVSNMPKVDRLYRGVSMGGVSETRFTESEMRAAFRRWTTKGETFDIPLSSFSADQSAVESFALWGGKGIIFEARNTRGMRVHAQVDPRWNDKRFVEGANARDEIVAHGTFKVLDVVEINTRYGPKTKVIIEQTDSPVSKSSSDEELKKELARLLSRPLGQEPSSKQTNVGKHFGGPSGKENHPITGSPQTVHNKGKGDFSRPSTESMVFSSTAVATAAAAGIMLLTRGKGAKTIKEGFRRIEPSRANELVVDTKLSAIAAHMNRTGDLPYNAPKKIFDIETAKALDDAIFVWKDNPFVIREYLYKNRIAPTRSGVPASAESFDTFLNTIAASPSTAPKLYRGMVVEVGDDLAKFTTKGGKFDLGPSSFSDRRDMAESFMGSSSRRENQVLLRTTGPTRALNIREVANRGPTEWYKSENEWVTAGTFQIRNVEKKVKHIPAQTIDYTQFGGSVKHFDAYDEVTWYVDVEQIMLFVSNVAGRFYKSLIRPAIVDKHMGPGPHPSGSPQEVHSIRTFKSSIRTLKSGDMAMFPTKELDAATEGYGFRFGNTGRILEMANSMLRGEDLFTRDGKTQPIMVMIYRDGQRVFDGKHRLAAARLIGREEVPIQVARVNRKMPEPRTVRERWDERRRQKYRERLASQPSGTVEYEQKVRELGQIQERFNRRMEERSRKADEKMFADLGITRGEGRWVAIKKDLSTVMAT